MEIVRKIEFNETEEKALKTMAAIRCEGIACGECPFDSHNTSGDGCMIDDIRNICNRHGINY